jgi:hypothetical protein
LLKLHGVSEEAMGLEHWWVDSDEENHKYPVSFFHPRFQEVLNAGHVDFMVIHVTEILGTVNHLRI